MSKVFKFQIQVIYFLFLLQVIKTVTCVYSSPSHNDTNPRLWFTNWHFSPAFSAFLLNTWTVNCQYASQFVSCPSVEIVSIDGGLRGSGPLTGTYLEWQLCFSVSQRGTVIRLGKARARMVNVSYHFGDTVIQIVLQYHEWTECFGSSKFGSLYITCSDHRVMQNQKIL